ncbi:MAG: carbohydrate porin [Gammaproteobacteria bacterium]|nr:carbohydrate porin [Gammaproteobacteria bacterium]MBU1777201.1 carbohydrate porin [Gammaproteobacteria bacterium]MBU1968859.1 carbohydrate porin [Gammaproteobacteria bacterium]
MPYFARCSATLIAASLLAIPAHASEDCTNWQTDTLSGDWSGLRSEWCDKGISIALTHKSDLLSNLSGGIDKGSVWLMNSEAAIDVDLDKLAGWSGTSAFVQFHAQHGGDSINKYTGSYAGVSNIETGTSTSQFYQAWLQKNSADDALSLLGGLYAVDSEFYVTESSGLFLQPPYGMSTELAQTGRNGPPIFPTGALGIRLRYSMENLYLQGALTDGVPGDPDNAHGTHIRLDSGDGTFAIAELAYVPQGEAGTISKTAIGLWRYTTRADDLSETDAQGQPLQRADLGAYILAERTLFAESGEQGLSGFVRFGVANKDAYQSDWSGSAGLNYPGLFEGRNDDSAGIAISTSHASAKYRQLNASDSHETVIEFTYRAQLQSWLAVQPDLQYVINPNMDPALENAWVAGMRVEMVF